MADQRTKQAALDELYQRDGCLRPTAVVSYARPKRSPLHDEFEWNDKVAGEQFRLQQARRLIRVTVRRSPTGVEEKWVHVPSEQIDGPTARDDDREGAYKPVSVVVQTPSEYERAMREMMSHLNAIERSVMALRKAKGEKPELLPTLSEAISNVKGIIRLMQEAA
jgi:hypothetical protein